MNNLPKLRFPEFLDAGDWEEKQLHQIASPVSERAKGKNKETALTLSAEYGIVSQGDYFGKRIAGENVDRYIKISLNDFVYNDRITKLFTYGTIKRLSQYQSGLVSPIYKCFRFKESENPVFWEWYFESGNHEIPLQKLVNEGARAGRFNISIQKFLSITVLSPESSEQQKIADCLSSIDDRITAETQKLDTLKAHKKGLMQQLFPAEGETLPKLRFPEFHDSGEWEEKKLGELIDYENGKAHENHIADKGKYIVVNSKFISTEGEVRKYTDNGFCIAEKEDILMVLSDVPNGRAIAKCYLVEVDNLYTVNQRICKIKPNGSVGKFLFYILDRNSFYLDFDDGVKQTNLRKEDVLSCPVFLPSLQQEQQKIVDCLSSIDEAIAAQSQAIELLKLHKKGLMQQLFPSVEEVIG